MSYVEYDSNNSGGNWWLDDNDWKALEAAGWKVDWESEKTDGFPWRPCHLGQAPRPDPARSRR